MHDVSLNIGPPKAHVVNVLSLICYHIVPLSCTCKICAPTTVICNWQILDAIAPMSSAAAMVHQPPAEVRLVLQASHPNLVPTYQHAARVLSGFSAAQVCPLCPTPPEISSCTCSASCIFMQPFC